MKDRFRLRPAVAHIESATFPICGNVLAPQMTDNIILPHCQMVYGRPEVACGKDLVTVDTLELVPIFLSYPARLRTTSDPSLNPQRPAQGPGHPWLM